MCGIVNVDFRLDGGFPSFFPASGEKKNIMVALRGRPHCNNEHAYENCPGYFSISECALYTS